MGIDEYQDKVDRSVWENKNGSKVTTVSGLLNTGKYRVKKQEKDNGTVVLEYVPIEDGQ